MSQDFPSLSSQVLHPEEEEVAAPEQVLSEADLRAIREDEEKALGERLATITTKEFIVTNWRDTRVPRHTFPRATFGLLPTRGLFSLIAPPKTGKSTLAAWLALAAARGIGAIPDAPEEAGIPTAYIAGEGSDITHQKLYDWQYWNDGSPKEWRAEDGMLALIARQAAADMMFIDSEDETMPRLTMLGEAGIKFLIIDSLIRTTMVDENSSVDMKRVMTPFQRWCEMFTGRILLLHHTNKGFEKRKPDQKAARGSSHITAETDENFFAWQEKDENGEALIRVQLNNSRFRDSGKVWSWKEVRGEGLEKVESGNKDMAVLLRFPTDGEWYSRSEVAPDLPKNRTNEALKRLVENNYLERTPHRPGAETKYRAVKNEQ